MKNVKIYEDREGFTVRVDGQTVSATFNSRGAAIAAVDVERRRRTLAALKRDR